MLFLKCWWLLTVGCQEQIFKSDYTSRTLPNSFQLELSLRKNFLKQFSLCHEIKTLTAFPFYFWWWVFFCFTPFLTCFFGFFVSLLLGFLFRFLLVCWVFFKTSFIFKLLELWRETKAFLKYYFL